MFNTLFSYKYLLVTNHSSPQGSSNIGLDQPHVQLNLLRHIFDKEVRTSNLHPLVELKKNKTHMLQSHFDPLLNHVSQQQITQNQDSNVSLSIQMYRGITFLLGRNDLFFGERLKLVIKLLKGLSGLIWVNLKLL